MASLRFAFVAVSAVILLAAGAQDAAAQCTGGGTRNCTFVPDGGLSFTSGVNTVNINGSPAPNAINANTIGINLRQSGVNGSAGLVFDQNTGTPTVPFDLDGDPMTPDVNVVADSTGMALFVGSDVIVDNGNGSFTVGGTNYADSAALNTFLQTQLGTTGGGSVSGSLTVNNPNTGSGQSMTTTNADGIVVGSTGGNGGNGGVVNLVLAESGEDGDDGGNGGSVALNSDTTITVNGGSTNEYGVSATSQGG